MEKPNNSPERAYEEAGRSFVEATKPIADFNWESRKQTFRDGAPKHQPVIAPKTSNSNERFYVIQSENFPGWLQTDQRWVNEGTGIAIAKYNNVSKVENRGKLISFGQAPNKRADTRILQIPDEILLIDLNIFKYKRDVQVKLTEPNVKQDGKHWKYDYIQAIGLAEYKKKDIEQMHFGVKNLWLDYGPGVGGFVAEKQVGLNIDDDSSNVPFQALSWPTIVYNPNLDGNDPFSWSTYQKHYKISDPLPKNTTYYADDINRLKQKWLAPFANGIREVPKEEL